MGKNSTPQYNAPAPPTLKTADQLYGSATNYAKTNTPLAYGARESGLADLAKGNSYYEGFQPSSFDEALGNKYFQNVWPGQEESIKHGLSLSGLDSSPLLADRLGKARGQTEFDIGSYLSNQGNQRAQNSLNERIGINPDDVLGGYLRTDTNQSNTQDQLNYDYAQQQAQVAYQQAVDKYNQQNALFKLIGGISPIGGAIYGGVAGGGQGLTQSLSGSGDALKSVLPMLMQMFSGSGASAVNPSGGGGVNDFSMASSPYNPSTYFSGFSGRGGAV